jgi:hypothetical protein
MPDTEELLPGVPLHLVRAAYAAAPGNEIASGKFASPESSSALVANTFGLFLDRPTDMPKFGAEMDWGWPPTAVRSHRREVADFAGIVAEDEVLFHATTYRDMLRSWDSSPLRTVREHVDAVRRRYAF